MLRLDVEKKDIDVKALRTRTAAKDGDVSRIVSEEVEVYHDGKLQLVHLHATEDLVPLLTVLKRIEFSKHFRTGGLKVCSRSFGFLPRVTIRRDYCTEASLVRDDPEAEQTFKQYAVKATRHMAERAPHISKLHETTLDEKVKPSWRLPGSIFTSGVANWDNQIYYHCDSGNFKDLWSAMYVMKRDTNGGDLVIPEFDLQLKFRTGSLLLFNGQQFLHGVTPMRKMNANGYRYTVVFYALQQLCHCLSPAEELGRIQKVKLTREMKRAGMPISDDE